MLKRGVGGWDFISVDSVSAREIVRKGEGCVELRTKWSLGKETVKISVSIITMKDTRWQQCHSMLNKFVFLQTYIQTCMHTIRTLHFD